MTTNVYIDGFNLYYGCLKGSQYKWLDIEALCRKLLPKDDIKRIRYFTARISARNDFDAPSRQEIYLRALSSLERVSIHFGEFYVSRTRMALANPPASGPRTVEVIKTEEKGSDVNISAYMILDAFRDDIDSAVVITNDSDLREPLRIVQEDLGLTTGVVNPHRSGKRSRALSASFFKQIRTSALGQCQLPASLVDAEGLRINKPPTW
jgi:uncharacterized LabA/DUF88 family protein